MKNNLEFHIEELKKDLKNVKDFENLKQVKAKYTSKSDYLNSLKKRIREVKNKKKLGEEIKLYSTAIHKLLENKKELLLNNSYLEKRTNPILDGEIITLEESRGEIHPLTEISLLVKKHLEKKKFVFQNPLEIEDDMHNFDVLGLTKDHPARSLQDTLYLENNKLLRTHSTNMTAREFLYKRSVEIPSFSVGKVYRNDDNDATHSFQFMQIDVSYLSKNVNIAMLKNSIDTLLQSIFGKDVLTRYRPSYFPFTNPSFEVDIKWNDKWLELLGSGLFTQLFLRNANKNPDKIQAYGYGVGLERLAILKYSVKDIREFYINDFDFLFSIRDPKKD